MNFGLYYWEGSIKDAEINIFDHPSVIYVVQMLYKLSMLRIPQMGELGTFSVQSFAYTATPAS